MKKVEQKKCLSCLLEKPLEKFRIYTPNRKRDPNKKRRRPVCIECQSIEDKKRDREGYFREYSKKYIANPKNRIKLYARKVLQQAIRSKTLIKGTECEFCGSKANIEAHHDDYNKPLKVRWLCKKHHYQADKSFL